jgi:hypothetical protein
MVTQDALAMSGFLSSISAKDMAIGASLTSISGSLSAMNEFKKKSRPPKWKTLILG